MVAGRARAVVVGVGAHTAMGSIRDSMLQTEDVRIVNLQFLLSCSRQKREIISLSIFSILFIHCMRSCCQISAT